MPVKSEAQRKAMGAALSGNSKLGIPKKVAQEFLAHAVKNPLPKKKKKKGKRKS